MPLSYEVQLQPSTLNLMGLSVKMKVVKRFNSNSRKLIKAFDWRSKRWIFIEIKSGQEVEYEEGVVGNVPGPSCYSGCGMMATIRDL